MRKTLAERFWTKVDKRGPDECWPWTARVSSWGYGQIISPPGPKQTVLTASRVSFEIHNGPIPSGMVVCHSCDNPRCCNPAHLWIGTHKDNCADRNRKGRQSRGLTRPGVKLTPEKVLAIRASEKDNAMLAAEYGVAPAYVWALKAKMYWKHI